MAREWGKLRSYFSVMVTVLRIMKSMAEIAETV